MEEQIWKKIDLTERRTKVGNIHDISLDLFNNFIENYVKVIEEINLKGERKGGERKIGGVEVDWDYDPMKRQVLRSIQPCITEYLPRKKVTTEEEKLWKEN